MKTLSSLLADARHRLSVLLRSDEAFAEAKFVEHRHYAAIALIITALAMPSLWLWDLAVDPAHADSTIPYRAYYLLGLPLGLAFLHTKYSRRILATLMLGFLLCGQVVFLQILKQLDNGFIYGMTGFMYGMLISVLAAQCLPVIPGMSFTVIAILLPHLYAAAGLAEHFPHLQAQTRLRTRPAIRAGQPQAAEARPGTRQQTQQQATCQKPAHHRHRSLQGHQRPLRALLWRLRHYQPGRDTAANRPPAKQLLPHRR